ncbi:uncharacterized protein LOC106418657 isoform X1 [Brassica napus]|uniref:uncharacterized protein LOC106418657 isoform X1 n=1 Tax=Brassica napus TaxID=3708 RepID=UPI002078629D|nr:uncharacterized protein LOC106418657 isoform X1 [Brassica napus]
MYSRRWDPGICVGDWFIKEFQERDSDDWKKGFPSNQSGIDLRFNKEILGKIRKWKRWIDRCRAPIIIKVKSSNYKRVLDCDSSQYFGFGTGLIGDLWLILKFGTARSGKKELVFGGVFSFFIISFLSIGVLFGLMGIRKLILVLVLWIFVKFWNKIIFRCFWYFNLLGVIVHHQNGSVTWAQRCGNVRRLEWVRVDKLWWRPLRLRRWGERGLTWRLMEYTDWYTDGFDQQHEFEMVMEYERLQNFGFLVLL